MIAKIRERLKRVGESGMFHDSRSDVRTISRYVNQIADKLDEVIDENNKLKSEIQKLKEEK